MNTHRHQWWWNEDEVTSGDFPFVCEDGCEEVLDGVEALDKLNEVAALEASLQRAQAKLGVMEQLLNECSMAIANVPDRAVFGIGGDKPTHWYLADELLANIAAVQEEQT